MNCLKRGVIGSVTTIAIRKRRAQKENAEAVDAEVIADAHSRNPLARLFELEAEVADTVLEPADDRQYEEECDDRSENPELSHGAARRTGRQGYQQRTRDREDDRKGEPWNAGGERVPAHPPSFQGR